MSASLIGMSFASFVVLLIVGGIAGAIVHWGPLSLVPGD
jgi:hypothetical protein